MPAAASPQLLHAWDSVPINPLGKGYTALERQIHRVTPMAILEAQPQISHHGPLCASSPFLPLHQDGCLPYPRAVPWVWLSHARQGHQCPGQGSGAEDALTPMGFMATVASASLSTSLSKGSSHTPNPSSDDFLHPQNTRLISQKPQTLKEEVEGNKEEEEKKKRVYNDFTSPDGLQKNLCAFIFAHSSGSDLLYNYVTFYLLCRGISTQLCLSQLSLGFL